MSDFGVSDAEKPDVVLKTRSALIKAAPNVCFGSDSGYTGCFSAHFFDSIEL
jgi:hypothetical protein